MGNLNVTQVLGKFFQIRNQINYLLLRAARDPYKIGLCCQVNMRCLGEIPPLYS